MNDRETTFQGFGSRRWANLVAETQFANDLVQHGLQRISRLSMRPSFSGAIAYDQTYPLHSGLHAFTSGLERLCKLTLACDGFLRTGKFLPVRKYSHRLSDLLESLSDVRLPANLGRLQRYTDAPADVFGERLVDWLQSYSSGPGRYELLDSLSSGAQDLPTWEEWRLLCALEAPEEDLKHIIALEKAGRDALSILASDNAMESVADSFLSGPLDLSEESAPVLLAMYRRARWAASLLAVITDYSHEELPILKEAVVSLLQGSLDFYAYDIARLSDPTVVEDEVGAFYRANPEAW